LSNQTPTTSITTGALPRSRAITAVAIFAALAIALHVSPLKIPAPYAPFLIYELWEVPIVAAFLLYGLRLGVAVAGINFLSLMVVFPGQLQAGPIYNLIAILSMMLGVLLAYRIIALNQRFRVSWSFGLAVILGPSVRVLVMTVVNATMLQFPPPIGFSIPLSALTAMLPLIALFNASVALYTIPLARVVAVAVSSATRIPVKYGK
jgi:riboflavin transporter FmnP